MVVGNSNKNLNLEDLVSRIISGAAEVQFQGVEFKESWSQRVGRDISAVANCLEIDNGWIVIGIKDTGRTCGKNSDQIRKMEHEVSNHIREYLSPSSAVLQSVAREVTNNHFCLFLEVANPGDVVRWDGNAYKLIGTSSHRMTPDEELELSLKLPGADFSKQQYADDVDPSLIIEFAKKVNEASDEFSIDIKTSTADEVLRKLNIFQTNVSNILFGQMGFRLVHFDENGDILDQQEKRGLFRILSDSFVESIQSWTRRQGTKTGKDSIAAAEEKPYPIKALREVLANAVAHALYQKNSGDIVVELHPDRMCVRNNCRLEAQAFVNKWFSRAHQPSNKHLMNTLRVPRITDEQGTGKMRVFRHMIEAGKREPVIGFEAYQDYGRWSVTLYNEESNAPLLKVVEKLKAQFEKPDFWRVATALILWRKKSWAEIKSYLDEHYTYVAESVLSDMACPVVRFRDQLITKLWVQQMLDGKGKAAFSEGEKELLYKVFIEYTHANGQEGFITAEDARYLIGLGNSKPDEAKLARLFGEWKKKGRVEQIDRGQWRFSKLVDG